MSKILLSAAAAISALSTVGFSEPPPALAPPALEGAVHGPDAAERFSINSYASGDYAFGAWGGLRTRLRDAGVTFDSYYVMDPAGNVSGGKKQGFTYVDNYYLGVNLDLEKLFGWRGLQLMVSGINRSGGSVTQAYVGSQYDVQQVHGGQNVYFYNLTLEQKIWDDKIRLKIGRFGASDDFNTSPIYGLYMNNGIDGNIRNVLFDTQFSAYPFATWAARLRVDPTPEFNFQFGVFQTWEKIFDPHHNGLDWSIRRGDGVMMLAQAGWTPEFFKKPVVQPEAGNSDAKTALVPEMKGLPGHYWIGGSYSPWKGYSQVRQTRENQRQLWLLPACRPDGLPRDAGQRTGAHNLRRIWILPSGKYFHHSFPAQRRRFLYRSHSIAQRRQDHYRTNLWAVWRRLRSDDRGHRKQQADLRNGGRNRIPDPVLQVCLSPAGLPVCLAARRHRHDSRRCGPRSPGGNLVLGSLRAPSANPFAIHIPPCRNPHPGRRERFYFQPPRKMNKLEQPDPPMRPEAPPPASKKPMFITKDGKNVFVTFVLLIFLFALWGFCNGMIDVMDKHFQEELHLSLAQSAWVQFAHYLGYFLMALPAGWLAMKLGYKGGIITGLLMVAAGGFWFIPATHIAAFGPSCLAFA